MYKILTQIHLNYKFKNITFKNIQTMAMYNIPSLTLGARFGYLQLQNRILDHFS